MDAPNLDLELTRLIAAGDRRRAATLLVTRFASDVFALCRAMVRDTTLAEDLSQDAFSRAIDAIATFRGESSARTWLLKIARNRCLDHLARAKRVPVVDTDDDVTDAHPSVERAPIDLLASREEADRALAAVSSTERALVVLHYGHGVGYPELAEAFALREGTLRMRLSRALARMRAALEASEGTIVSEDLELDEESAEAVMPARRARAQIAHAPVPQRPMGIARPGGPPPPAAAPNAMPAPSARAPSGFVPRSAAVGFDVLHDVAPRSLLTRLDALLSAV